MARFVRWWAAWLVGAAALAPALSGQTRTVTGLVMDSASRKPISDVLVYLDRTDTNRRTGKDGRFQIAAAPTDTLVVVRRPGYVPGRVAVSPGADPLEVGTVYLRQVKTDADRAAVDAEDQRLHPELAAFYERKGRLPQGYFFAPDEVQRTGARQPSDLLRRTQGLRSLCVRDRQGEPDCGQQSGRGTRGTGLNAGFEASEPTCLTAVWQDGALARIPLDDISMGEVLAVEAYANMGTTPPEFAGSRCGVVAVWTQPGK